MKRQSSRPGKSKQRSNKQAQKRTNRQRAVARDKEVLKRQGRLRASDSVREDRSNQNENRGEGKLNEQGFIAKLGELVSADEILEAGRRLGALKRQRKVDLPALVRATILSMCPIPGAETSAMVNYLAMTGVPLVASSFYDRYSEPFAALMRQLAVRAIEMVREVAPEDRAVEEYGVLFEKFDDVQLADASSQMLQRLARGWAPSTSKKRPAGVKIHTVISLRDHLPVAVDVTEQKRHDNAALPQDTLKPGTLTFFDLGYLDVRRFIEMTRRGAQFVTRLKSSHNPVIHRVWRGKGKRRQARGMRLDEALKQNILEFPSDFHAGHVDLDVVLQHGSEQAIVRLVGVQNDEGQRWWYLLNVDRDVLPAEDVTPAYRLRWDIELLFKQLKSGAGLSAVLAWRSSAVLAFLYAKIVALCLARLLELSVEHKYGPRATTQMALLLTLSRSVPLLLGVFLQEQGITIEEFERRLLMIASIVAKSRRQARERRKRKQRQAIGK